MKLEFISISGFRGIESIILKECGEFNVIIGKNNAGKSTILMAIDAFFESVKTGGGLVSINPPYKHKVDYHYKRTNKSIEFAFSFHLTLPERDELIQDTISEAPRLKHVVEGIHSDLMLTVTIITTPLPSPVAYVKSIVLHRYSEMNLSNGVGGRTVLAVSDACAKELADRAKQTHLGTKEAEYLDDMTEYTDNRPESGWMKLKNEIAERRRILRSPFPFSRSAKAPPSTAIQDKLFDIIETSDSQAEFKEKIQVEIASLRKAVEDVKNAPLKNQIESFSGMESSIPTYSLKLLERLAKVNVLYLKERREPIGNKEAEQILQLKIERGGEQTLNRIKQTVSGLLGVKIDAFGSKSSRLVAENDAELDVDDFLVQVNGAGIREALRLILDYEFARPDILLVEEPEIHLHPALETNMMRYLKRIGAECQIFITTHSTNFLDTAEMRNIYLASNSSSTQIQLLDVHEAEVSIPQELGIRLSALFMFDRLVFIEGPSDEQVLREFAATLGINLSQQSVGFVPMGGVRNLAHFAAESTLAFLTKRRVRMWFIIDRDERDDEEVQRLTKSLENKASVKVLRKREIENYLISPRAIMEFIQIKQRLANIDVQHSPTIKQVERAISECTEQLKEVALQRRVVKRICTPIYPNRNAILEDKDGKNFLQRLTEELSAQQDKVGQMIDEAEKLMQEENTILNSRWDTNSADFVPGDILLDDICKQFGVRFNKDRDSSRMASLIRNEEIDSDIKSLIQDIGT
jgi:putative ATP-dependent endonuclease of the OLD family